MKISFHLRDRFTFDENRYDKRILYKGVGGRMGKGVKKVDTLSGRGVG